ncbi:peptide ABC transporter substrate-binding protein [Eggerthia catenaformis]|uniref:peptide ABC transporter substrate-binding protein n=1 Tax=Eggerthia catenaformis TaxID=31973 RepID=UPI00248D4391|nr:peptide ABC transporter substrate-binding protein [Eggerthia catenaformis]
MKKQLLLILLSVLMLSGCVGSKYSNKDTVFRMTQYTSVKTLDSSLANDESSVIALHTINDGLYGYDKYGNIQEELAKEYEVSADGLTYTFKIKKAKWSNGDYITADDFVYGWQRAFSSRSPNTYLFTSLGAHIKGADKLYKSQSVSQSDLNTLGIKAKNKDTLTVTLTKPVDDLKSYLTLPAFYPLNRKFVEKAGNKYASSKEYILSNGAYLIDQWNNQKITFKKNQNYYDKKNIPTDRIEMFFNISSKQTAKMFEKHQIDYGAISGNITEKYSKKDTFIKKENQTAWYLAPNFKSRYMSNKYLRASLSYALNRTALAGKILKDRAKALSGLVPAGIEADSTGKFIRDSARTQIITNLRKARQLMRQVIKAKEFPTVTIAYMDNSPESKVIAQKIASRLNIIGHIDFKIKKVNDFSNRNYDLYLVSKRAQYLSAIPFLSLLASQSKENFGSYHNIKYDYKLDEVSNQENQNNRFDLILKLEKIALEDYALIPLIQGAKSYLQGTNISYLVEKNIGIPLILKYVLVR